MKSVTKLLLLVLFVRPVLSIPNGGILEQVALLDSQLTALTTVITAAPAPTPIAKKVAARKRTFPTLTSWYDALRALEEFPASYPTESPLTFNEFLQAITDTAEIIKEQHTNSSWINNKKPDQELYTLEKNIFVPFVQKLLVPVGAEIALWGDLHGSAQSLGSCLWQLKNLGYIDDQFKIIKNNFYMLFLGDYVDRGKYGAEVFYTLLRLKIANPERVFTTRGNHEDESINYSYGFHAELLAKFSTNRAAFGRIYNFYNLLPVALYLGSGPEDNRTFVQCCHGGLEPGFDPQLLLLSSQSLQVIEELYRGTYLLGEPNPKYQKVGDPDKKIIENAIFSKNELENVTLTSPTNPVALGFMWHDFNAHRPTTFVEFTPGRGWMYGREFTELMLTWANVSTTQRAMPQQPAKKYRVTLRGLIRAHQHNSSMYPELWNTKGAFSMWNGTVITLFSGPANFLPGSPEPYIFNYDSFVLLKTGISYTNWQFTHWWREFKTAEKPGSKNTQWQSEKVDHVNTK